MGSGAYDPGVYARTVGAAAAAGKSFAHTTSIRSGATKASVHTLLDPKTVAGAASPLAGQIVREARDNDDHPTSLPIMVSFDQTGSMAHVPMLLQKKFVELHTLVQTKGYVEHPQLSLGAYGDMDNREVAPIQVSAFEADNRADQALDNLYLEGSGGGNGHESAAGVWLYAALHTATDAWDKRGKKGYLITVGDETTGGVRRDLWKHYVDKDSTLEKDLTSQEVADLAKERWDVYHVVISNGAARSQGSVQHYEKLLGKDHVIVLEDEEAAAETIALLIGMAEGVIDIDAGLADMDDVGSTADKGTVTRALSRVSGTRGGGVIAVADAPADLTSGTDAGVSRL